MVILTINLAIGNVYGNSKMNDNQNVRNNCIEIPCIRMHVAQILMDILWMITLMKIIICTSNVHGRIKKYANVCATECVW